VSYLEKGGPMPASLGRCADLLYDVKQLRLEMQRQTDEIKARETEITNHIISNANADNQAFGGQHHIAKIVKEEEPVIEDWGVFCSWVRKNDRFDLIQKRINSKAVSEVNATQGRSLPGLGTFTAVKISLTKL